MKPLLKDEENKEEKPCRQMNSVSKHRKTGAWSVGSETTRCHFSEIQKQADAGGRMGPDEVGHLSTWEFWIHLQVLETQQRLQCRMTWSA